MAATKLLRLGVVFLGAQLSISAVGRIGGLAIGLVLALMLVALAIAIAGERILGVPPRLGVIIAVGTAICGYTAIHTTAPIIDAEDREVSYAVAVITAFGTLALFAYPFLGLLMMMDQPTFGIWAGSAINDTSQG